MPNTPSLPEIKQLPFGIHCLFSLKPSPLTVEGKVISSQISVPEQFNFFTTQLQNMESTINHAIAKRPILKPYAQKTEAILHTLTTSYQHTQDVLARFPIFEKNTPENRQGAAKAFCQAFHDKQMVTLPIQGGDLGNNTCMDVVSLYQNHMTITSNQGTRLRRFFHRKANTGFSTYLINPDKVSPEVISQALTEGQRLENIKNTLIKALDGEPQNHLSHLRACAHKPLKTEGIVPFKSAIHAQSTLFAAQQGWSAPLKAGFTWKKKIISFIKIEFINKLCKSFPKNYSNAKISGLYDFTKSFAKIYVDKMLKMYHFKDKIKPHPVHHLGTFISHKLLNLLPKTDIKTILDELFEKNKTKINDLSTHKKDLSINYISKQIDMIGAQTPEKTMLTSSRELQCFFQDITISCILFEKVNLTIKLVGIVNVISKIYNGNSGFPICFYWNDYLNKTKANSIQHKSSDHIDPNGKECTLNLESILN